MMYVHSLGRAARYYSERPAAIGSKVRYSTFRELHDRVVTVAAALSRRGFRAGDRLAMLLPNEPDYLELIYACSWLGVIAVLVNARFSAAEIDRVLADASPRGVIRHSSLPATTVQLSWDLVLDKEPLDASDGSCPDPIYDPDAILALIYTSGTTGHPKGVAVTHANIQANIDHLNYWMPYREGGTSTRRRFFTYSIFRSSLRRRPSALARSRSRSSAQRASARRLSGNASATPFWCQR
jgi:acyl-CoA synthetase (AMP-forming)/AMP-acid ligase II